MAIAYVKKDDRLAIRLPAKTKFAVELMARRAGKSTADLLGDILSTVSREPKYGLYIQCDDGEHQFLPELCWDRLVPDRLVKIALNAPELLTDDETVVWKVIVADRSYWHDNQNPNFEKIREDWGKLDDKAKKLIEEHG